MNKKNLLGICGFISFNVFATSTLSNIVAVGDNTIVSSENGIAWQVNIPSDLGTNTLTSVFFDRTVTNLFVVVGTGGFMYVSNDGKFWTRVNSGTTEDLLSVTYYQLPSGEGKFFVLGAHGTLLSSLDATNWVVQSVPSLEGAKSLSVRRSGGSNSLLAVGSSGLVLSSVDSTTWKTEMLPCLEVTCSTSDNITGVTSDGVMDTAVSQLGNIYTNMTGGAMMWMRELSFIDGQLNGVSVNDNGQIVAVGSDVLGEGVVSVMFNLVARWSQYVVAVDKTAVAPLNAVAYSNELHEWVFVGQKTTLVLSKTGTSNFTLVSNITPVATLNLTSVAVR